jgi:hypothetical protein
MACPELALSLDKASTELRTELYNKLKKAVDTAHIRQGL